MEVEMTMNQRRKQQRDRMVLEMFEELRKASPGASRTAVEETIGREMAKRGYDLTTRVGVHKVLVRLMGGVTDISTGLTGKDDDKQHKTKTGK